MKILFGSIALSTLLLISACGAEEPVHSASLYSGVWAGNAGEDTFVFQFNEPGGECPGVIHCIRDGRKYSEMRMTTVSWEPPQVEAYMDATGITYSGQLQDNMIIGGIGGLQMDLELTEPSGVPGLLALRAAYSYSRPAESEDGITTADCAGAGIAPDKAEQLVNRIASGDAGVIHSLLIWSGGNLVIEQYFHGYVQDDLHRTMSVSKSVASLLTGIAIDQDLIENTAIPMNSFFDDFPDEITLEHLLSMSMGLNWTDADAETVHLTGEEFFSEVSRMNQAISPGSEFRYVNPDVNLLSGIIFQASGLYPDQFAEEYLFEPMGIDEYDWSFGETDGHRLMDGSLHLRPRDMMKLGLLVLNGGIWNGTRLVSSEWLGLSTEPVFTVDSIFSYGYLWWLTSFNAGAAEYHVILASGWGSQFIAIIPEAGIVIVTTGGNDDNGMNWEVLQLISETLFDRRLM